MRCRCRETWVVSDLADDPGFPVTTSDFITVSLTFASPLPANLNLETSNNGGDALLSWTISDQNTTLSEGAGNYLDFAYFGTDASGKITGWAISALTNSTCNSNCWELGTYETAGGTAESNNDASDFFPDGDGGPDISAYNVYDSGTWTAASGAPEPATFGLGGLGLAIACLVGAWRARRIQRNPEV